MSMRNVLLACLFFMIAPLNAQALCIYSGEHFEKSDLRDFDGRMNAKTTLAGEFADSSLVIRGTVLADQAIYSSADHDNADEWGDLYRIRVDQIFKGAASGQIIDYSERDSGGFYLDKGGQFLLFLNPRLDMDWVRKLAPHAYAINYNCGVSRTWVEVSLSTQAELMVLSIAKALFGFDVPVFNAGVWMLIAGLAAGVLALAVFGVAYIRR